MISPELWFGGWAVVISIAYTTHHYVMKRANRKFEAGLRPAIDPWTAVEADKGIEYLKALNELNVLAPTDDPAEKTLAKYLEQKAETEKRFSYDVIQHNRLPSQLLNDWDNRSGMLNAMQGQADLSGLMNHQQDAQRRNLVQGTYTQLYAPGLRGLFDDSLYHGKLFKMDDPPDKEKH
jgi:hypothetical protein